MAWLSPASEPCTLTEWVAYRAELPAAHREIPDLFHLRAVYVGLWIPDGTMPLAWNVEHKVYGDGWVCVDQYPDGRSACAALDRIAARLFRLRRGARYDPEW